MEQTDLALIAVAAVILVLIGLSGLVHYRKRRQGGLFPAIIHWSRNMHNMGSKMKILPPDSARWYANVIRQYIILLYQSLKRLQISEQTTDINESAEI